MGHAGGAGRTTRGPSPRSVSGSPFEHRIPLRRRTERRRVLDRAGRAGPSKAANPTVWMPRQGPRRIGLRLPQTDHHLCQDRPVGGVLALST